MGFTEEPFYQDDDPAIQSAPKVSFPGRGLTMRIAMADLAALLLAGWHCPAALAEERILDFASRRRDPARRLARRDRDDPRQRRERSDQPRHLPRFPDPLRGPHGGRMRVGFTFLDASLDGSRCPAKTRRSATACGSSSAIPIVTCPPASTRYVDPLSRDPRDRPFHGI